MRQRNVITVKTGVFGTGEDRSYPATIRLAMDDADAQDAEQCSAKIVAGCNVQLERSKSHLRVVLYDTKLKKIVFAQKRDDAN